MGRVKEERCGGEKWMVQPVYLSGFFLAVFVYVAPRHCGSINPWVQLHVYRGMMSNVFGVETGDVNSKP